MLTIRPAQQATFAAASREEFMQRMERHLREHFAPVVEPLSKEQFREVIVRNWKRAEEYGLTSELGVCSYLNCVFTLGENFEEQRDFIWAGTLLSDEQIAEPEKLNLLEDGITSNLESTTD